MPHASVYLSTYIAPPAISWRMTCYHYERRTHNHKHGDDSSTDEEVETWRADNDLTYTNWCDNSLPRIQRLGDFKRSRINFYKIFNFADAASETSFMDQRNQFIEANKHRDFYYDIHEHFK